MVFHSTMNHISCPHCNRRKLTKNGHFRNKQRWFCNKCQKTFTTEASRNFPPTSVPFEFIAWVLYQKEANTKNLTKITNSYLSFFNFKKEKVSRSTIYRWSRKYSNNYKKLLTPRDITLFFKDQIKLIYSPQKPRFEDIEMKRILNPGKDKISWTRAAIYLRDAFGEEQLLTIIREDHELFKKMINGIKAPIAPEIQNYTIEAMVSIVKGKKFYSI